MSLPAVPELAFPTLFSEEEIDARREARIATLLDPRVRPFDYLRRRYPKLATRFEEVWGTAEFEPLVGRLLAGFRERRRDVPPDLAAAFAVLGDAHRQMRFGIVPIWQVTDPEAARSSRVPAWWACEGSVRA